MIGLVVTLEVKEGKQSEFEAGAKDLMAKVKANEPGCLIYQLYKAKDSDTKYVFMEQYASKDAHKAHGETAHFKAALPMMIDCLAGPSQIEMLDIVE